MNNTLNYFYVNNTKILNIEKNRNIIDYLENLNVKIPHYCYHPKLSISGNCRMCLIELKNSPKPLISCAMTITNKMELFTNSPLVKKARENILEFLLLNHPLDCPVCDQGGECDLQDQSMVFGSSKKRFYNYKRSVKNKNLGPIVKTVMTRCIHCTRCVRFACEVAGVSDLGTFGRGYHSEIGTYINKIFNSELSGNIIDICPVGALTTKPYSFVDRSWELSQTKSLDFTDSFGHSVILSIKNHLNVTKIQPFHNEKHSFNYWITNKTRFSFDGMFSPERFSNTFFTNTVTKKSQNTNWKLIFKEILKILYFQNHLNKTLKIEGKLSFIVGGSTNLEVLNILNILAKKFKFISIKKLEKTISPLDLEENIFTDNVNSELQLNKSSFCLLIGIDTRFESSSLNIKLRQRYLQGNFQVYSISSILDLTFKVNNLGSNFNILKQITEGNHLICQKLINAKNPQIIYNVNLFKQSCIFNLLINLKNVFKAKNIKWSGFNYVNTSLLESTNNYISSLSLLKKKDLCHSFGLYLINENLENRLLKKIVFLKTMGLFITNNLNLRYAINQSNFLWSEKKSLKHITLVLNLPTTTFFEEQNSYITTEGFYKKVSKVISVKTKSKNSWEILRKLFSEISKTNLNCDSKTIQILNASKKFLFLKFVNLNHLPIQTLKKSNFPILHKKKFINLNLALNKRKVTQKLNKTKIFFWLDDFYLNGKDNYSKYSKIMIECSKISRLQTVNFKFLN